MSASKIKIRAMKEEDVQAIANIESSCFSKPWTEDNVRYEIKGNPCAHIFIATIDEEIVGYLDFMITFNSATISRICVLGEYRRKGIAQALLNKMFEVVSKQDEKVEWITLEVRKDNEAAQKLYKKNHWEEITIKKNYYDDGTDAIYMVRSETL